MSKYSLFTKLVIYGCALCILPVLILGFFSYMKSSQAIQSHVNEGNLRTIKQMNGNIEQVLRRLDNGLNQVANSTLMDEAIFGPLTFREFQKYNNLRRELSYIQSFDSKVSEVVIFNKINNWLINNSGLYAFEGSAEQEALLPLMALPTQSSWTLLPSRSAASACPYTVSLIKKLPTGSFDPRGLAVASIPVCTLADMMDNDGTHGEAMIVGPDGRIWVHPDQALIGKPLTETSFLTQEDLHQLAGSSGQFETRTDAGHFTVTYVHSDFNGWRYLSFSENSVVTQESRAIGWFTAYVCIIVIVISVCAVWLGSRRMYTPVRGILKAIADRLPDPLPRKANEFQLINEHIQQLFHSNSSLKNELHQNSQMVRTFFLSKLYGGQLKESDVKERLELYGYGEQLGRWEYMAVLTLQIDMLEQTRYEEKDHDLLLFAVNNIIEEVIPPEQRIMPVILDQTQVTLVGSADRSPEEFNSFLYRLTESIQTHVRSFLDLSVSIGISLPFQTLSKASRAYQEGLEALKHRLKLGKGVVISYAGINSGKHTLIYPFPQQLESELIDAIKLADEEKALELLKQWMNEVFHKDRSLQDYQISLIRLLNDLMIVMQESGISLRQIDPEGGSLYDELLQLYASSEIEKWFKTKLVQPLVQVFKDRRDSQYQNLSEQIIHLIHTHYDTDITLEECAARLHYNAFYLSSVFKKETNQSFSDYLAAYRLNMAKKWLVETDIPIKDIAQKLRYNNPQNFIRSFRKQTDMTPGQYRSKYARTAEG
ncbi:helix-turn-helix domain-containing protein [Paenibacillus ginsengihumi]|uniref:helix-turn-helix domain-containing protein n=1 Tax=Paenibacillus ginsengihumi TaxID=431596 RepID=UPI00036A7366|nr:helix-turn-helix domain-containing protein [Paenibacillus ginsengihumi]